MTRYGAQFGGTQLLDAVRRVCLEALSGLAARRKGLSHDPSGLLLEGR